MLPVKYKKRNDCPTALMQLPLISHKAKRICNLAFSPYLSAMLVKIFSKIREAVPELSRNDTHQIHFNPDYGRKLQLSHTCSNYSRTMKESSKSRKI